ncbi:MAG: AI-2E family transporter [Candidatus Woesearchaeota archaeon]
MISKKTLMWSGVATILLVIAGLAMYFFPLVTFNLLLAITIFYAMKPIIERLELKGYSTKMAVVITILLYIIIANVFFIGGMYLLLTNPDALTLPGGSELSAKKYIDKLDAKYPSFRVKNYFSEEKIAALEKRIDEAASEFLSLMVVLLVNMILIVPILTFIIAIDRHELRKKAVSIIPNRYFEIITTIFSRINTEFGGFLRAKFIENVGVGIVTTIGFLIAGVNGAIFLGILAGILNTIPYVGAVIGLIPAVLVASSQDSSVLVGVILTFVASHMISNFFIIPYFYSKIIEIHPLAVIVSLLVFEELFGVVGAILAIPLYSVIKITYSEIYKETTALKRFSTME